MKLKLKSDGTTLGTHLIDEATGRRVEGISSIEYNIDTKKSELTVKFHNIPVEIETGAFVSVLDWDSELGICPSHTLSKQVKISSGGKEGYPRSILIQDAESGKTVSAVQSVCLKADDDLCQTTLTKIKFDHTDWV